jgi:hypothetical protein
MKNKLNTVLAALFLTTTSFTAFAVTDDSEKFYVTVGAMKVTSDAFDELKSSTGLTIDDEDTAASFIVGYQVNDNLSLEAGIISEVEMSITLTSNLDTTFNGKTLTINSGSGAKAKAESYTLGFKYLTPVSEKFDIYGKAGVLFWDVKVDAVGTVTYDGTTYSGSTQVYAHDGNDAYYGLGGAYNINQDYSFNVDYIKMDVDDDTYDGLSATVALKF